MPDSFTAKVQGAVAAADAGEPSDIVTAFAEDGRGGMFVGTYGAGLTHVDRSRGETQRLQSDGTAASLSDDRVMALLTDRDGRLWIGTKKGGLNRFNAATGTFTVFRHDSEDPASLGADGVMSLYEDVAGSLWVGTFGGGLSRLDGETFTTFRNDPSKVTSLSADHVTCVLDAGKGRLWVGTHGGGLNLLDPATGRAARLLHDAEDATSLPADTVLALHEDADGRLWVGTRGGGLAQMIGRPDVGDGEVGFRVYDETHGLPNSVVYSILPDTSGGLWLSTNHGLSRFDPALGAFDNFDTRHGLQANEFNFGAAYRSATGELYFGGINGYNAFFPERLLEPRRVAATSSVRLASDRVLAPSPLVPAARLATRVD